MKNKFRNFIKHERIIATILLVVIISSISVGYAVNGTLLTFGGSAYVVSEEIHNGEFVMTSFVETQVSEGASSSFNTFVKNENVDNVIFQSQLALSGSGNNVYYKFTASFYNDTNDYYTFNGVPFNEYYGPRLKVLGKEKGSIIKPGEKFDIILFYYYDSEAPEICWVDTIFEFLKGKQNIESGALVGVLSKTNYQMTNGVYEYNESVAISNNLSSCMGYSIKSTNSNVKIKTTDGNINDNYFNIIPAQTFNTDFTFVLEGDLSSIIITEIYLETDDKKNPILGTVTFYPEGYVDPNPDQPEVDEPDSYDTVSAIEITPRTGWADHYSANLTITNNTDQDIKDFIIQVELNPDYYVDETDQYGPTNYEYTLSDNVMSISSKHMYSSELDMVIPANGTLTVSEFSLCLVGYTGENYSELIKSVKVLPSVTSYEITKRSALKKNVPNSNVGVKAALNS